MGMNIADKLSLRELWDQSPESTDYVSERLLTKLPGDIQLFIRHAVSSDTRISKAVWLRMHGEIRLKNWLPFVAEQVISWERGMIWAATVKMYGIPVKGSDRVIDGEGMLKWKLLEKKKEFRLT